MTDYGTRPKEYRGTDGSTDAELIADGGRSRCSECGAALPEEIEPGTGVYCTQCGTGQLVTDGGEVTIQRATVLKKISGHADAPDWLFVPHEQSFETTEAFRTEDGNEVEATYERVLVWDITPAIDRDEWREWSAEPPTPVDVAMGGEVDLGDIVSVSQYENGEYVLEGLGGYATFTTESINNRALVDAFDDRDGELVTDGGEEHVPVLLVAYEDDADLEINEDGEIENHDELVSAGQTYDEIRMLSRSSIEGTPLEDDIVEPGDSLYYDAVADLDPDEAIRVDDMLSDEDGDDDE